MSKRAAYDLNTQVSLRLNQYVTVMLKCHIDTRLSTMCSLYKGMPLMVTRNLCKQRAVVNGQRGILCGIRGSNLDLRLDDGNILIHPVTVVNPYDTFKYLVLYPVVPCYATTMCKFQGQTLKNVCIFFDVDLVPSGSGYVAVTRVKSLSALSFVVKPKPIHFRPVNCL